jgi:hypothetical protein
MQDRENCEICLSVDFIVNVIARIIWLSVQGEKKIKNFYRLTGPVFTGGVEGLGVLEK